MGWAPKIETFLGSEMATSEEPSAIWTQKKPLVLVCIIFQEKTRGVRSYNVYLSSYFNTFTPLIHIMSNFIFSCLQVGLYFK